MGKFYISKLLIKDLRKSKNFTQHDLAKKAKVAQETISDIELNKKSPTLATLDKIATALNVPTNKLFIVTKIKK